MIKVQQGWVYDNKDVTQSGRFQVVFEDANGDRSVIETVNYVSPYGNRSSGFIAIPEPGSSVLVISDDDPKQPSSLKGKYYLGSVLGLPHNIETTESEPPPDEQYVPSNKPGLAGPGAPNTAESTRKKGPWPTAFQNMYKGLGTIPDAMGLTNWRGDAFRITQSNRPTDRPDPYQDYRIGMQSGSGKRVELVDSPGVNGIVMDNGNKGKDFFIWCAESNKTNPFSGGEWHMRTHGPVNMYTTDNNFSIGVIDGFNVNIANESTGSKSYSGGINTGPTGGGMTIDDLRGYTLGRKGQFGNEDTGCINIASKWNNVSISALGDDSVIHIHAPGENAKVIVESGGTVDIVADKKITLQSKAEIELNAPIIDINAYDEETQLPGQVNVDGGTITMNTFLDSVTPPSTVNLQYTPATSPVPYVGLNLPPPVFVTTGLAGPTGSPPETNSYPPEL